MKSKNSKAIKVTVTQTMMLWTAVLALTLLRLAVATSGSLTESEAFLSVCGAHPAGSYVEGPAGVPLLLAFLKMCMGAGFLPLRCISPLAILILSWCVWWIGRKLAPHRPALALWSVLGLNLLPSVNLASLVMNGAALMAALFLVAFIAGWNAAEKNSKGLVPWSLFGLSLAATTLFWQPAGLLLPAAIAFAFVKHGVKNLPWKGMVLSAIFLILGWVPSLAWNSRHDWIQWGGVAAGFDSVKIGALTGSLGMIVALGGLAIPFLVRLAYVGMIWRAVMLLLAGLASFVSCLVLMAPRLLPEGLPSPIGVMGVSQLSGDLLSLHHQRPDSRGNSPFLIASTPGLASLLGSRISIDYPERPGSPSVFVVESPSLSSSYSLWPSYPDAVAAGVKDNLYTEEKSVSPFLGRNALYVTQETKEELPQTITGAFNAVALLKEVPITVNGNQVLIRIYQCEGYRTLSL